MPRAGSSDVSRVIAASGRARWPAIKLTAQKLAEHLDNLGISSGPNLMTHALDLYLATACASGDPDAVAEFEREFIGENIRSYLGRLAVDEVMLDELKQIVRIKLLGGRPPRIARYNAAGPLGAWVRVTTARTALDLLSEAARGSDREPPDAALAARIAGQVVPENDLARAAYAPVFQAALERALARLPARERGVLKFHFVEGLAIDAIGTIYRVHRATVARWLVHIRQRLWEAIELDLQIRLGTSASEFRSLLGVVRDDLRASLERVLEGDRGSGHGD